MKTLFVWTITFLFSLIYIKNNIWSAGIASFTSLAFYIIFVSNKIWDSVCQEPPNDGKYLCIKCEKKNTTFAKMKPKLNGSCEIYITCDSCIRGWKIIEYDN